MSWGRGNVRAEARQILNQSAGAASSSAFGAWEESHRRPLQTPGATCMDIRNRKKLQLKFCEADVKPHNPLVNEHRVDIRDPEVLPQPASCAARLWRCSGALRGNVHFRHSLSLEPASSHACIPDGEQERWGSRMQATQGPVTMMPWPGTTGGRRLADSCGHPSAPTPSIRMPVPPSPGRHCPTGSSPIPPWRARNLSEAPRSPGPCAARVPGGAARRDRIKQLDWVSFGQRNHRCSSAPQPHDALFATAVAHLAASAGSGAPPPGASDTLARLARSRSRAPAGACMQQAGAPFSTLGGGGVVRVPGSRGSITWEALPESASSRAPSNAWTCSASTAPASAPASAPAATTPEGRGAPSRGAGWGAMVDVRAEAAEADAREVERAERGKEAELRDPGLPPDWADAAASWGKRPGSPGARRPAATAPARARTPGTAGRAERSARSRLSSARSAASAPAAAFGLLGCQEEPGLRARGAYSPLLEMGAGGGVPLCAQVPRALWVQHMRTRSPARSLRPGAPPSGAAPWRNDYS